MAMPKLPFEDMPAVEKAMQWALDDLLTYKKQPSEEDLAALPQGDLLETVNALNLALEKGGEVGLKRSFLTLCKNIDAQVKANGNKPNWLVELRNKPVPPRIGDESGQAEEQKPKRRVQFVDDDVIENMPAREWLISGILPRSGVCILFGLPETYKSFLAVDWALSVGFGRGWHGRASRKGGVAYIAGEGFAGLGARSKAWKAYNGMSGKSGVKWYGDSIDLTDPSSINELYEALDEDFISGSLELIVIDTFSRNSGAAEENSNTDVKKFMHTADLLQKKYGCAVLIIHHSGKSPEKGPRGASAFVGNTETIISVDLITIGILQGVKIGCFKQKDAEKFDPIALAIHKVQYGQQSDESSLVLIKTEMPVDDNPLADAKKSEQVMYEILQGKELTLTDWVAIGMSRGISESSAKKARKELYEVRQVIGYKKDGKLYYILESEQGNE